MPNQELAPVKEVKNSGVAIVLSFFWTGLGQLYAGRIGRGITMMIATPLVGLTVFLVAGTVMLAGAGSAESPEAGIAGIGVAGVCSIGAWLSWWVWGMVDARRLCDRENASA